MHLIILQLQSLNFVELMVLTLAALRAHDRNYGSQDSAVPVASDGGNHEAASAEPCQKKTWMQVQRAKAVAAVKEMQQRLADSAPMTSEELQAWKTLTEWVDSLMLNKSASESSSVSSGDSKTSISKLVGEISDSSDSSDSSDNSTSRSRAERVEAEEQEADTNSCRRSRKRPPTTSINIALDEVARAKKARHFVEMLEVAILNQPVTWNLQGLQRFPSGPPLIFCWFVMRNAKFLTKS